MKRQYLADLLDIEICASWLNGKKVLINAPTGAGKSTLVLRKLLDCCKVQRKRMVILCNRRMLRVQYSYDLADRYWRYVAMCSEVEVWTYQELAEKLRLCSNVRTLFSEFDVIVCDEVHYFYSDSDFNAFGTFCLLQALIIAGFYKTILMFSATMDEVKPLILNTFHAVETRLKEIDTCPNFEQYRFNGDIYNFRDLEDFSRFTCCWLPDVESLAEEIATSPDKSIVFIDDKNLAEKFRELLLKTEYIKSSDVFVLNADVLEEESANPVIKSLGMTGKLIPKVLLTTSVLDNGVSVHDEAVGNIVIATDSKVSFLQMLGRVRAEENDSCRLFIFPRTFRYYERRVLQYENKVREFERLEKQLPYVDEYPLLVDAWYRNDEDAVFMRNALVITKEEYHVFNENKRYVAFRRGEMMLAINTFAKEKVGNLLLELWIQHKLSLINPISVAERQIAWMKKAPSELCVMTSTYKEKRIALLKEKLLEVKEFTNEQLQEHKVEIAKEFRGDLIGDIVKKTTSFSIEKLENVCDRYGLQLKKETADDKRLRYSILLKKDFHNESRR